MKTFEIEFAFNDAFGFSIKHQNGKGEIGGGSLSEQFNKIIQNKGYDKKIALKTYCGKFVLSVPHEQAVANSAKLFDLFSAFKDILWNQYASGTTPADFTVYMLIYDGYSLAEKQIFSSIEYRNDEKHSALSVDEFLASVNELLGIEAQRKETQNEKVLTEQEIKQYLDLKNKIEVKARDIVKIFDQSLDHDSIDHFNIWEKEREVGITVGGSYRGEYQTECYEHPIDYFFKSTEELKKIKRKELEKEAELQRKAKEKAEEAAKILRHREYLKLKEEFEQSHKEN